MGAQNAYMTIKEKLQRQLPLLKESYHISSLGLFGSYVRADQLPESDLLSIKVDLVMRDALKSRIGARILKEVTPV